ncbi:MAG: hypothetical protein Q8O40_09210 [Chloroflexota bacterium]|nr:hypothetical protein [Chloroflexota bacterium]
MTEETRGLEKEFAALPSVVLEEFQRARTLVNGVFDEHDVEAWGREGLAIANQTQRSWEAAAEYFRASPEVARYLTVPAFLQWSRSGAALSQDSPSLAVAYFKASPGIVSNLRPQNIAKWAALGRSLYKGTWKSGVLATKFFDLGPELMRNVPFWDVELFVGLLESLAYKSYDGATECLSLGTRVLSSLGKEREAFISMSRAIADSDWREMKGCLDSGTKAVAAVEENERVRFLRLSERLARAGGSGMDAFLTDAARTFAQVSPTEHRQVLDMCELLLNRTAKAVPAYMRSLPVVLSRITFNQLETWFTEGVRILQENPEGGLAFFRLESSTSEQLLEGLSSSLELERVHEVMRMYCRALAGASIEIASSKELADKGIGWVSEGHASTEGTKVFLPPVVDRYPDKAQNFAWYKVVSTHQVAHLEFGSFDYLFDEPAPLFKDLRHQLEVNQPPRKRPVSDAPDAKDDGSAERGWVTDMGRFFNLFDDRKLALDVFTVLEDGRLDYRVKWEYRGIARAYSQVQLEALAERPPVEGLPLRQAMMELLIRLSLEQRKGLPVPVQYLREVKLIARVVRRLLNVTATVQDTAEATLRVYGVLSKLPNQQVPEDEWDQQDMEQDEEFSDEEMEQLLQDLQARQMQPQEGEEKEYESPEDVDFRGDFKPELVQLLTRLRGDGKADLKLTKEQLEELLRHSAELKLDEQQQQMPNALELYIENLMKEAGIQLQSDRSKGYGPSTNDEDGGGPLEAREPRTYAYDEWDFRANDYKPRWCIVREKNMDEGEVTFYNDTLRNYAGLMKDIRRQFELVMPERFRRLRRVNEGEDIELDPAIEAMIDLRIGVNPSDKVYWRRSKIEREVAVAFLLDMSASTAEAIDDGRHSMDDRDAPSDPVEYMTWLRQRREGPSRRNYKRIIDLEKESTALLINALEGIGDSYGIYGFSGYGRENVEFYVIKDVKEGFSDKIKKRLDKITPLHATRMGPAIRHTISKLERQEARTKFLFLISDGRPQDRGYSREGVEKEYAIHDTHMALLEARRKNITPFCLTVDKAGHDYLKAMCGDVGYEVLGDIWALPRRLPSLYKKLTF